MMEIFTTSTYFGAAITIAAFILATIINKKWPNPFTTPLFLATTVVVVILVLLKIPYENYNQSAKYLTYFLMPVTVCFAVPMYRQLPLLKKHIWTILFAMFVGVIASVVSVCLVVALIGMADIIARSLVSISVTTALAIGITRKLGGMVSLTVSAVIITGILGASVSDKLCKWMKLKNSISRGLAIGNASHAAGTVKAMEMGHIEGSFSSLAIVISGLMTAAMAPIAIWFYFG